MRGLHIRASWKPWVPRYPVRVAKWQLPDVCVLSQLAFICRKSGRCHGARGIWRNVETSNQAQHLSRRRREESGWCCDPRLFTGDLRLPVCLQLQDFSSLSSPPPHHSADCLTLDGGPYTVTSSHHSRKLQKEKNCQIYKMSSITC